MCVVKDVIPVIHLPFWKLFYAEEFFGVFASISTFYLWAIYFDHNFSLHASVTEDFSNVSF